MSKQNIIQRPTPDLTGQPVVNFQLDDFQALVWSKGYDVIVEEMVKCPCKSNGGSNLSDCVNCQSTGYVFINPYSSRMILHSMNYTNKYKEWSEEKIGKVTITALQRDRLNFMDRITVVDSEAVLSELVTLKLYNTTKFLYTIYDILSIVDVFTFDSSNLPLRKLTEGVDYTFTRNKIIITTSDEVGKTFTVRYKHNQQYHVIDLVHDIRNSSKLDDNGNLQSESFPINAIGRLAHYNVSGLNYTGDNIFDNSYD